MGYGDYKRTNPAEDGDAVHMGHDGWYELKPYGIDYLTGEACGYGGRVLCDLTSEGVAFLQDFFGMQITLGNEWNRGVASIKLPRSIFKALCIHALFYDGWPVVFSNESGCWGMTLGYWEERGDQLLAGYPGSNIHVNRGTAGTNNRHEMSGRV